MKMLLYPPNHFMTILQLVVPTLLHQIRFLCAIFHERYISPKYEEIKNQNCLAEMITLYI